MIGVSSLRRMKFAPPIVALGPWALGVVIALVTPDDILSRSSLLRGYAEWFANIFPYISRAAAHSAFPEVTLFFHAVMWSIAPVWMGVWLQIKPDTRLYEKQKNHRFFIIFALMTMLGLLIFMLNYSFTLDSLTRSQLIMSHSRFGLGFVGVPAYAGGWVFYIYILTIWIRRIPALYFSQSNKGETS